MTVYISVEDHVLPIIEYRFGAREEDFGVQLQLEGLTGVPEVIHRAVSWYGGRIVLCNGSLTENPEKCGRVQKMKNISL